MITLENLISSFKKLGLSSGDIVMAHSSFKSFSLDGDIIDDGPITVINAILKIIGEEGTLVMPTFTPSFCEQFNKLGSGYFDLYNSPSEMGILSETLRKMNGVKRSINPIYSIVAYGRYEDELTSVDDKNVFGKSSIFAKLYNLNAKILMIGVDYDHSFTISHYVEQKVGCDYRYMKDFSGTIVIKEKKFLDTFTMNVRNLEKNVIANLNPMGAILEEKGICKILKIGGSMVKIFNSRDACDALEKEMKKNPYILCLFGNN